MKLYHGTFSEIESFRPSSHFGDETQAIITMGIHRFGDREKFQNGEPRIYECEINLEPKEILQVNDWGAPNHQANFRGFCLGIDRMDLFNAYQNKFKGKNDPQWLTELQKEANARGYVAMSYLNVVENLPNKKSPSWMVIDPKRIAILNCYKPSWIKIHNMLEQYDPSNLQGVDWNSVMAKAREQAGIAP